MRGGRGNSGLTVLEFAVLITFIIVMGIVALLTLVSVGY